MGREARAHPSPGLLMSIPHRVDILVRDQATGNLEQVSQLVCVCGCRSWYYYDYDLVRRTDGRTWLVDTKEARSLVKPAQPVRHPHIQCTECATAYCDGSCGAPPTET